ncbi:hypothetical protein J2X34_000556 [Rhodococcus sp. BE178]
MPFDDSDLYPRAAVFTAAGSSAPDSTATTAALTGPRGSGIGIGIGFPDQ